MTLVSVEYLSVNEIIGYPFGNLDEKFIVKFVIQLFTLQISEYSLEFINSKKDELGIRFLFFFIKRNINDRYQDAIGLLLE